MDYFLVDHFGIGLRIVRQKLRISQGKLADCSFLNRSFISQLETGIKKPSLKTVIAIATGLGMKVSELLRKIEECLESIGILKQL